LAGFPAHTGRRAGRRPFARNRRCRPELKNNPMEIDWFTFVAQIINFVILVYLLWRFLYEPITNAMKQRERSITARLREAEERRQQAQAETERYQQMMDEFAGQKSALLSEARADSERTRRQLMEQARHDVQWQREHWMKALQREQKDLINLIQHQTGQQAVGIAGKALRELADTDLQQQTVACFLRLLEQLPSQEAERLRGIVGRDKDHHARILTAFEIPGDLRQKLQDEVAERLGITMLRFEVAPELVCGIELRFNDNKIGWSVNEYLESFSEHLQSSLATE
jgi:F-type H+-transporting ATPase subunit b